MGPEGHAVPHRACLQDVRTQKGVWKGGVPHAGRAQSGVAVLMMFLWLALGSAALIAVVALLQALLCPYEEKCATLDYRSSQGPSSQD